MTRIEDDKYKYEVNQIDSATGLPLTCNSHQMQVWCACRTMVVTEGLDGPTLWHYFQTHDSQTHEVRVHVTKSTIVRLTLYIEEWPTDRAVSRMQVMLRGDDIAKREPFASDVQLTRLGWLNHNEGRGVLRELIMNRFASIFVMQENECLSTYHTAVEHTAYLKSRVHGARAWDWDYLTWYEHGVCPPCHERTQQRLMETMGVLQEELVPKATADEVKPWELPTDKYGRVIEI